MASNGMSSPSLSALIQVQSTVPARSGDSTLPFALRRTATPSTEPGMENPRSGDDPKAKEAANKFEALLIHNMLKSMRRTTMAEDTSNERALYDDMLDEKLATTMMEAGGLGVAEHLLKQMRSGTESREQVAATSESTHTTGFKAHSRLRELARGIEHGGKPTQNSTAAIVNEVNSQPTPLDTAEAFAGLSTTDVVRLRMASELWDTGTNHSRLIQQQHFLQPLIPHARRNAERLGTSTSAILAIAALETGWGQSMIKTESGASTHNLFGIKATGMDVNYTTSKTTEFIDGKPRKIEARFKKFRNTAEAVNGFADFVLKNPRYSTALKHAGDPERFLKELHTAGYATDPQYADKAISVLRQIERYPSSL